MDEPLYDARNPHPSCRVSHVPRPKITGLTEAQRKWARKGQGPLPLGIKPATKCIGNIHPRTHRVWPNGPRPRSKPRKMSIRNPVFQGVPKSGTIIQGQIDNLMDKRAKARESRLLDQTLRAIRKEWDSMFVRCERELLDMAPPHRRAKYVKQITHALKCVDLG